MQPLVLLVEDDKSNLAARRKGFEDRECSVLAVSNANDAIRELSAGHLVSLVVTDINLRPDADDVSGVALARYMRETGRDMPVAGYSAHFAEQSQAVPNATRDELFDLYYPRSKLRARQIGKVLDELAGVARAHLQVKLDEVDEYLEDTVAPSMPEGDDFRSYRELMPSERAVAEQVRNLAEPHLRRIDPAAENGLRRAVYLIVREAGPLYEVEVLGVPTLYAVATSADGAVGQLIDLMRGFGSDLSDLGELGMPAQQLREFLVAVLA